MNPTLIATCECGTTYALYPYHYRPQGAEVVCHRCWSTYHAHVLGMMDCVLITQERIGFSPHDPTRLAIAPEGAVMLFTGIVRMTDGAILAGIDGYAFWLTNDQWKRTTRRLRNHVVTPTTAGALILDGIQHELGSHLIGTSS